MGSIPDNIPESSAPEDEVVGVIESKFIPPAGLVAALPCEMGIGAGIDWLRLDFSDGWRWMAAELEFALSPKRIVSGECASACCTNCRRSPVDEAGVTTRLELNAAFKALNPLLAGVGVTRASSDKSVLLDAENERAGFRTEPCRCSFGGGSSAWPVSCGKLRSE